MDLWTDGDWNGDGKEDLSDLQLWQENYDTVGIDEGLTVRDASGDPLDMDPAPEAATLALCALGLLGFSALRRPRRGLAW